MAINKNFVIKNGIQVNDNLFVADPDNNQIGINTALPDYDFHVIGGIGVTHARVSGVTTSLGDLLVGTDGTALAVKVSAGNSVGVGTDVPEYPLHVKGPASIGQIAEYVYGDLEVTGDINSSNFSSGSASFSGITTFTSTVQNTLGDPETGAVQVRGGLGVSKNLTVSEGLYVGGYSYFVGIVTFAAGAAGTIQLGDNADDNIEFQADVNSNIIPNTTASFDLGSSSQKWRDLHLAGNAGIGSLAITGISTFSDNVEISSLTENRIPIVGAGSTIEDDANLTFDGSRLAVGVALTVSGISTFSGNIDADGDLDVDGHTELDDLNVSGVSTFASNLDINASVDISDDLVINDALNVVGLSTFGYDVDINADVDISGNAGIGSLVVSGISTFSNNVEISSLTENRIPIVGAGSTIEDDANLTFDGSQLVVGVGATVGGALTVTGNVDLNADLDVDGHTELDDLNVSGVSTFVGVATFTNTTENTLGTADSGAVKIAGGLGVAGNVTVGGGLSVTGNSYFVGMVTFAAGTDGNITLGDSNTDNVIFNADVNSNIIPNTNDAYNLGSGTQQWKDFFATGNAGIGSLSVAGVSTFGGAVDINASVDISDDLVINDALNVVGLSTFGSDVDINADIDVSGNAGIGSLSVAGVSTFVGVATFQSGIVVAGVTTYSDDVDINGNLDVDGRTDLDDLVVTGVSTYSADLDVNADIDVSGNAGIGSLNVVGVSTFGGITTFTDTTQNTLGSTDTAAVKIAGGLAVAKNVTVGGGLSVTGNSYFVGMVTFAAGTDGNIVLGDTSGDNVVFNADVNSNLIPNTNGAYDLGSSSQKWADLYLTGNAGVGSVHVAGISTFVGIATFNNGIVIHSGISTFLTTVDIDGNLDVDGRTDLDDLVVTGVSTFSANIDADGDLDVDGHTELDDLNVTGVSTFSGNLNLSGNITSNVTIVSTDDGSSAAPELTLYRDSASPAPGDYLGQIMFKGENSNSGEENYAKITGKISDETLGTEDGLIETAIKGDGSFTIVSRQTSDQLQLLNGVGLSVDGDSTFAGGIDVDGHTELDDLNVTGVATFAQSEFSNINVSGITTTQILYVGSGGTTLTVDANNATFAIGSATTTVTATMNGGAIPSIGLVIALGG